MKLQQLGDPSSVATTWHQIGIAYRKQELFEEAESAYRQSLSIKTQQGDRTGEAKTLGELGNLYNDWNRPKQALDYHRQAADIHTQLGDKASEGRERSNIANILMQLKRTNEARPELIRAIACKKDFGHATTPWKTWDILYHLERADDNPRAAHAARHQAIHTLLIVEMAGKAITAQDVCAGSSCR